MGRSSPGGCPAASEKWRPLRRYRRRGQGAGDPEAMHEKVFAPFFRLEASRNRETGGVGLGLAIARTIVRYHGRDIAFSQGDPGFRVTIDLPKKV